MSFGSLTRTLSKPTSSSLLGRKFKVGSFNMLSNWWYVFKCYQQSVNTEHRSWPYRQVLMMDYIKSLDVDILCVQEINPNCFTADFAFMKEEYECVLEESNNKWMRCAIFWRKNVFKLKAPPRKTYRSIVLALTLTNSTSIQTDEKVKKQQEKQEMKETITTSSVQELDIIVATCHLAAGSVPDERLRQLHDALAAARKLTTLLKRSVDNTPVILSGDFNCGHMNSTARQFLLNQLIDSTWIDPEFPNVSVARKNKTHPFSSLSDAYADVYGSHQSRPPTFIVPQLFNKFKNGGFAGEFNSQFFQAIQEIFSKFSKDGHVMDVEDMVRWIDCIHGPVDSRSLDGANQVESPIPHLLSLFPTTLSFVLFLFISTIYVIFGTYFKYLNRKLWRLKFFAENRLKPQLSFKRKKKNLQRIRYRIYPSFPPISVRRRGV